MTRKRILAVLFLLFLVIGTFFVLSRSRYHTSEGRIFGTTYHVKYAGTQQLNQEIIEELRKVDHALSIFNDTSVISRFNRNETYVPNEMFEEVVKLSQQLAAQTDGAFDITVEPLVNAWGFGFKNKENVTPSQIDSLKAFVGYEKLHIANNAFSKKDPRLALDCGAVAKGYGVDRIAKLLSEKGCTNYMVEIGGEVVVKGKNPKGKPWSLGINKPVEDSTQTNNEIQSIIQLTDKAVATSGNYRNFYYKDGQKYAHTIDPKTGYPVQHSLLSATVVASSCTRADALATAFMVMGVEKAKTFVSAHTDADAYLIFASPDGTLHTWMSEGMKKHLQK